MASRTASSLLNHLRSLAEATGGGIVLGFSGGLDSSVLLEAMVRAGLARRMHAVHVHHGLAADADAWAGHCAEQCRIRGVPFSLRRITLPAGGNLEERARRARRRALVLGLGEADQLWLAHHRNDQAETLLLRLMRGAGSRGLAAMAPSGHWQAHRVVRPLLYLDRSAIERLGREWGLDWIEDPSNQDSTPDRNFLRNRVLPLLAERWPAAVARLAAAAARLRQDAELLEALGALDLAGCDARGDSLALAGLGELSAARQRNLLRHWLRTLGRRPPPARVLERVLDELLPAAPDRMPEVVWPDGVFLRHGRRLYLKAAEDLLPWQGEPVWRATTRILENGPVRVERVPAYTPGALAIPERALPLRLAAAGGGERLLRGGRHRQVPELWRQAGVPPWRRRQLPLFFHGDRLVAVAGLGVADDWRPAPGEAVLWLRVGEPPGAPRDPA